MAHIKDSTLERGFALVLAGVSPSVPMARREYTFHPTRRWRFDFAWVPERVAVELEGAIFTAGRHSRGIGYAKDCEKHNAAVVLGWRVLRYTTTDLEKRPIQCAEEVARLIQAVRIGGLR